MEKHPLNNRGDKTFEAIVYRLTDRKAKIMIFLARVLQNETGTGTTIKQQRSNRNPILVCTDASLRYVGSCYEPGEKVIYPLQVHEARCGGTRSKRAVSILSHQFWFAEVKAQIEAHDKTQVASSELHAQEANLDDERGSIQCRKLACNL